MNNQFNLPADQLAAIREDAGRFNEAWTTQEKEVVKELFRDGNRIEEIARLQGRTRNAIRIRLTQEGEIAPYLSRREQAWTEEEIERLGRFHSQGYSPNECAKMLGRLSHEARAKLIETGLLEPPKKSERNSDYPKAYEPWTEEETERLNQELAALSNYKETLAALAAIAESHGRSLGSIVSKAGKMGLNGTV